jgi:Tfp pilus assembly protein PilP
MTKQKKGFLLGGLIVLWGLLMFTQFSEDPAQTGFSISPVELSPHNVQPKTNSPEMAIVLEPARQNVSFSNPRNIFAPLTFKKPTPPPPKRKPKPVVAKPPKPKRKKPPPPSGPSPGELAAQQARQLLNKYRFLGYLKKGGESQAFLTNGKDIYIVRQGEIMEGRIHVNRIDPTTIVLSTKVKETGDQIEATIPLTKEKKG